MTLPFVNQPRPRLLLVDDDVTCLRIIQEALSTQGSYDIVTHVGGIGAFEEIQRVMPALVMLDVMMPDKGGVDVLREIRTTYAPLEMPVVMCTACEEPEQVSEALSLGANDYLLKPIHPTVATARINTQLRLRALSGELSIRRRDEALAAMVVTYNHEINNALTVAMISMERAWAADDEQAFARCKGAMQRIAQIMRAIRNAQAIGIELTTYRGETKMVKLT
jgi:DNA-binding response OmpR family regulator